MQYQVCLCSATGRRLGSSSKVKGKETEMYTIIVLKADGRMVLYSYSDVQPDLSCLSNELEGFDYTQVLILHNGCQISRFTYNETPRLNSVGLV